MKSSQACRSARGIGRSTRTAIALASLLLASCDLVLGIDEVSSENGPDGGRRIQASTADPWLDASAEEDSGAEPETL